MPKPIEKPYFAIREAEKYDARPTHEEIGVRAYQIYVERGGVDGYDVEDWLQAEQQLLAKHPTLDQIAKTAAA